MPLPEKLLEILACPACRAEVIVPANRKNTLLCVNAGCRRSYRIEDDIPIMLVEESVQVPEPEWRAAVALR